MKIYNIITKTVIFLVILICTSCIDHYQIKTKVMKDGSMLRTISVTGDSASLFNGLINVPTDSTWNINLSWEYKDKDDTTSDKSYTHTATKLFKSFNQLNTFLKVEDDTSRMTNTSIKLIKKFRWFYTFYRYVETYQQRFPFNHYPSEQFISDKELSFFYDDEYTYSPQKDSLIHIKDLYQMPLLTSVDSVRMEELEDGIMLKLAEWQSRNAFEEYLILINELADLSSFSDSAKESLYKSSKIKNEFFLDFDESENALKYIAQYFGLTENKIKQQLPQKSKVFYTQLEHGVDYVNNNEIRNQLELPGLLINCNADSIHTNTAYWTFNDNWYFANDFKITAESRTINKWAFILTGIVVLTLLSLFLIGLRRK